MRRLFVFLGVVLMTIGSAVRAQEVDSTAPLQKSSRGDAEKVDITEYIPDVSIDMRGGYGQDFTEKTGRFYGDGLYLNIDGKINPNFSYSLNQRLASTYYEDNSGFNGTNWLTLSYEVSDFAFTFGKDALLVGSFEYDAYDLDTYCNMNSMFYNTFDCWQWGVSATWYPSDSHEIILQAANSPFSYGESNLFAYAAAWRGAWDCYESYWTANMWQLEKGRYVKALNFGNRFSFGSFIVDLEYMTRAADLNGMFTRDFTTILAPSYEWEWGRAFAKLAYEHVAADLPYELAYDSGDCFTYGAGFEFFPLKEDRDVRIHAAWMSNNWGMNILDIGLTWKFDITGTAKHIFGKLNK